MQKMGDRIFFRFFFALLYVSILAFWLHSLFLTRTSSNNRVQFVSEKTDLCVDKKVDNDVKQFRLLYPSLQKAIVRILKL